MPRIPDNEIERLKNEVSVERLVEASGVELKKAGKDKLGCCPFHDDAEASLVVTPAKNLWHCFGCQIGGGPIDWVIKSRGVSFRHAVELLKADPSLAVGQVGTKRTTVRSLPAPVAVAVQATALKLRRSAGGCAASTGTAGAVVAVAADPPAVARAKTAKACHAVQASKSARTA